MKIGSTFALLFAVLAFSSGLLLSATSVAQTTQINTTGDWKVQAAGANFAHGVITLHQEGSTVVGHYGTNGSISGKMGTATRLDATWTDSRGTGWLTAHFSEDAKTFHGEWGFQGKPISGRFVAQRMPGTPSPHGT